MTQSANPFIVPEAFDTIRIAGEDVPGLAVVKAVRKHKYDEKKSKGSKGSKSTYVGSDLVEVSIDITLFTQEQYDAYLVFAPTLEPDPKKPKALDASHPHLDAVKVRSIVITESPAPDHQGGGLWTVAIKAKEFTNVPKDAGGTPDGSKGSSGRGGGSSTPQSTAEDERQKEIARLLAEANKP